MVGGGKERRLSTASPTTVIAVKPGAGRVLRMRLKYGPGGYLEDGQQ